MFDLDNDNYESFDTLLMSSLKTEDSWVMEQEQGGVFLLGDDEACKVYGINTVGLKMFNDRKFLLQNLSYVSKIKWNLFSINMFDDPGYYIIVEHKVFKILHVRVIIAKVSKLYGLYILEGSSVVVYSSLNIIPFHEKNKLFDLRSRYDGCLNVVSEHLMSFANRG